MRSLDSLWEDNAGMRLAVLLATVVLLVVAPASHAEEIPPLVDARWLHARLGQPGVRVIDMVTEPKEYRVGHIPGAVYLNVDDVRVAVAEGGYRLPTVEEGARLLGSLGLTPQTQVVAYDDSGGLHAARLFFTLEALGHRRVSVLDGGIQAWRRAGSPVSRDIPSVAPSVYRPRPRPELVADETWIVDRLKDPGVVLLDTRSLAEYRGTDVRARRGGHIPGAVHVEWRDNLRPDLTFKPADELRAMYAARGIVPDKTVVTYCQTHHRAAHTYFVLRLLGFPSLAGYDRSWSQWGNRADLPIARQP